MSDQKFTMTGRVVHLGEVETRGAWSTRRVVIETDGKYPQTPEFEFGGKDGKNIAKLDTVGIGDEVSIDFEIRGRRWDGPKGTKWFNTLSGWQINVVRSGARPAAPNPSGSAWGTGDPNGPDNGLPF